jgi:hypothetical protein
MSFMRVSKLTVTKPQQGWLGRPAAQSHPSHGPIANSQSRKFHAGLPPFVNIWRGSRIVNSLYSPTSLSTVIVPPCCFVTMS